MKKGIVYYTDNRLDGTPIGKTVQEQLLRCTRDMEIVSVSLKPIDFGQNISLSLERGYLSMFTQILTGLIANSADVVFLTEHDVLYHPVHFQFDPPDPSTYYYNENTWKLRADDGQALFYYCKQTLGLCAYRELLIEHYEKRLARIKADGRYDYAIGFEPGCHRPPRGIDYYKAVGYMAKYPNIDIRHGKNLTPSRWSQDQFRNKNSCLGWEWSDDIPGWGITKGRFNEFLEGLGREVEYVAT